MVLVRGPSEHERTLAVEIAGLTVDAAQAVHAHLRGVAQPTKRLPRASA